jgi:ribosomal protein S18 acetylase RimI-like enzyme
MPYNHQITIATATDIPALEMLVNSAYRGDSSKKGWTTEADLLDGIRTTRSSLAITLQNPDAVILKYTNVQGDIIGCVYLQKKGSKLYLGMLTVSPEIQAMGIGKQLLTAAEAYAKQHDCSAITMTVISVRKELIGWYERHGYCPTGETEPFPVGPEFGLPKQPLHFIVMEKSMAGS